VIIAGSREICTNYEATTVQGTGFISVMNKDFILKNTRSYDEWLIEHLKDPEEAQTYLGASLEEYEKDGG